MYLLIMEDGTSVLTEKISDADKKAADDGYLDIYDLQDGLNIYRYEDTLWVRVQPL